MKATSTLLGLEKEVGRLVREHLAAYEQCVKHAVERGFGAARGAPRRGQGRSRRKPTRGRRAAEVAKLGERLYALVCSSPGSPMASLAAEMELSSKELHRPMQALKKAGRVRSVGQRNVTRYFPMATPAETAPG